MGRILFPLPQKFIASLRFNIFCVCLFFKIFLELFHHTLFHYYPSCEQHHFFCVLWEHMGNRLYLVCMQPRLRILNYVTFPAHYRLNTCLKSE